MPSPDSMLDFKLASMPFHASTCHSRACSDASVSFQPVCSKVILVPPSCSGLKDTMTSVNSPDSSIPQRDRVLSTQTRGYAAHHIANGTARGAHRFTISGVKIKLELPTRPRFNFRDRRKPLGYPRRLRPCSPKELHVGLDYGFLNNGHVYSSKHIVLIVP